MNGVVLLSVLAGVSGMLITSAFADRYSNIVVSADMKEVSVETRFTNVWTGKPETIEETMSVRDVPIQNITERVRSFNSHDGDQRRQGQIKACTSLIDIPGGRNNSYGAFCSLEQNGKSEKIAVCDAEMTNAFKIQAIDNANWTKPDLIAFVMNNCFGG